MGVYFTQPLASHGGLNWDTNLEAALTELKTKANYSDQGIPGGDLNQITVSGHYYGSSLANSPNGTGNGFEVLTMIRPDGQTGSQFAQNVNGDQVYSRRRLSGSWQPWVQVWNDSGWVVSPGTGINAATGFSIQSARYRIVNNVVSLSVQVTRTGSTVTANAKGVLSGGLPTVSLPAVIQAATIANGNIATTGGFSTVWAAGYVSASLNQIVLTQTAPSGTIATNDVLELNGTYFL